MVCALCQIREADKTNTHYLSDSVIRTALNKDGDTRRGRGFYFGIETGAKYSSFNFQRDTPVSALEEAFGRLPEEDEIEAAKETPFSVDYVFCSTCEDIFTAIENKFTSRLLDYFRQTNFDEQDYISLRGDDILDIRWFFLLQIWRTTVCEPEFNITPENAERLRVMILNSQEEQIKEFSLAITYLNTLGEPKEYTRNFVGVTNDRNPSIIFMNDFIIQFYEDVDTIKFDPLSGFNSEEDFRDNINSNEDSFVIKVISDTLRKKLLYELTKASNALPSVTDLMTDFIDEYERYYKSTPSLIHLYRYLQGLHIQDMEDLLQLTEKRIRSYMTHFIRTHKPV